MITEEEFLAREKEKNRRNKLKNRPIILTTYIMVFVMVALVGYVIYFMQFKAEEVIANSHNTRQDDFADVVERGDIITSDGVVIATSDTKDGETTRSYPYDNMFAHVVGYDKYGKSGLELEGNFYMLRSHINIFERVYKQINEEKNRGDNIITTLDFDMQNAAYNAMGPCDGAVVCIEPYTGKIRVMLSKPDFNPNNIDTLFEYLDTEEGSKSTVLLNRVTQGSYAPGSTFKLVTLLEYLREKGVMADSFNYNCTGNSMIEGVDMNCAYGGVHGEENLKDAFAYSCNTAFAEIGVGLDYERYNTTAKELLFNKELPYAACKNSYFGIDGYSSSTELPQTAIGQGDTTISPMHLAMIVSAVANDGELMEPYLIEEIENDDGGSVKKFKKSVYGDLITSDESKILTEYMMAVCDYGTAAPYFSGASYDMAGKTGTAEYDDVGGCNSWFVGFSNPEDPDLVVCVIVEDYNIYGVSGASVARAILDTYYAK